MDVLHTATLRLDHELSSTAAAIGHPLPAVLTIKHTKRWANAGSTTNTPLAFTYAIDAPPDSPWLVAGPKRSRFTMTNEDVETKVSLVLVPLRAGMHLLPGVDIHPVAANIEPLSSDGLPRLLSSGQNGTAAEEETTQPLVSCETDYRSSGETVMVMRDARTTTVTVRERETQAMLQRIPTATESVRGSVDSTRTSRLL